MPKRRREKPAERSGPEQEKTRTAEPAGPAQDQAQAERPSQREGAWAELCGKLGAQASSDPAAMLDQAVLMAAYGPAFAILAANQADALMFYNAVANQQKTNILSMSVTAKCVRYMFEAGQICDDDDGDGDGDDILEQSVDKE